jgi:hypothetical protein
VSPCPLDGHPTVEDNLTLKAPKILQITPCMEPLGLMRTTTHGVDTMFKNSAEGGKPDMSDSVGFWKNQENSAKFGKIQSKHTGNDRRIVKTGNADIQLVSPINQHFFLKISVEIFGRILSETGRFFCRKSVNGTKNREK